MKLGGMRLLDWLFGTTHVRMRLFAPRGIRVSNAAYLGGG